MKTFQRIIRASALALAIAAVPMLASASPSADAQAPSSTKSATCDCTMHHRAGRDAQAKKASDKERSASHDRAARDFEQQVWTAP